MKPILCSIAEITKPSGNDAARSTHGRVWRRKKRQTLGAARIARNNCERRPNLVETTYEKSEKCLEQAEEESASAVDRKRSTRALARNRWSRIGGNRKGKDQQSDPGREYGLIGAGGRRRKHFSRRETHKSAARHMSTKKFGVSLADLRSVGNKID